VYSKKNTILIHCSMYLLLLYSSYPSNLSLMHQRARVLCTFSLHDLNIDEYTSVFREDTTFFL